MMIIIKIEKYIDWTIHWLNSLLFLFNYISWAIIHLSFQKYYKNVTKH